MIIKCKNCGDEFERKSRSEYCRICRPTIRRERQRQREQERRNKIGLEINARQREKYANDSDYRERKSESKKKIYDKMMGDDNLHAIHNQKHKDYQRDHRQNKKWDGNWYKAMERDDFHCVVCGREDHLAVHHKDGKGDNVPEELRNHDLENLVTLCNSCHAKIHKLGEQGRKVIEENRRLLALVTS